MLFIIMKISFVMAILTTFFSHVNLNKIDPVTKIKQFDYYILREIWPPTSCMFPGSHSVKKIMKLYIELSNVYLKKSASSQEIFLHG